MGGWLVLGSTTITLLRPALFRVPFDGALSIVNQPSFKTSASDAAAQMIKWIRIKKFCSVTGYTDDAVRAKMSQGVWLEGILWKKAPDGNITINPRAYNRWVEGQVSAPQAPAPSKSTSATKGSDAGNVSAFRRRQPTSSTPSDSRR